MEPITKKYYPLGSKTLFMLIIKRAVILILLLPFLFFGLFMINQIPADYTDIVINILFGYTAFLLLALIAVLLVSWLEYVRYSVFLNEKDLQVSRGLITTEEIGIPYRRVQDIKIKRTLVDQIFGVSDIIITVLGPESSEAFDQEKNIILPSLDQKIAKEIQDALLRRAQVEQINVLAGQKS